MKVRANKKLDNGTFEWCFGAGLSTYKTEEKAIEQDIESSLLEWKNNCFFALNHGIDWRTRLGSKNQKELLDADVIETISNRYGVYDVTDFVNPDYYQAFLKQRKKYAIILSEIIVVT